MKIIGKPKKISKILDRLVAERDEGRGASDPAIYAAYDIEIARIEAALIMSSDWPEMVLDEILMGRDLS